MSFAKNVKKYQKVMLGSVVAVMALSLVVWGNPTAERGDKTRKVAVIFGSVPVTASELADAYEKALPYERLRLLEKYKSNPQMAQYMGMILEKVLPGHKPEDPKKTAKEIVVLTFDAKTKAIRVADEEVVAFCDQIYRSAKQTDSSPEMQANFWLVTFGATVPVFRSAVRDYLMIQKGIALELQGASVKYHKIFEDMLADAKSASVAVIGVDPEQIPGEAPEVGPEAILAKYELEKDKYKIPGKAAVEYIMADFEEFKKRATDPTNEAIEKYYKDFKQQFVKPIAPGHDHKEGEKHDGHEEPKQEFKELADVRQEIIDKIKGQDASKAAYDLIRKINSEDVGNILGRFEAEEKKADPAAAAKDIKDRVLKRTAAALQEICDKYLNQGVTLVHDVSGLFDKTKFEIVESSIGKAKGTQPIEWIFANKEGEISMKPHQTEKGWVLFRIAAFKEAYDGGLTDGIREKLAKELRVEEKKKRGKRLADEIERELRDGKDVAFSKIRTRKGVEVQTSGYFTPDQGDPALTPSTLSRHVKELVFNGNTACPIDSVFPQPGDGDHSMWSYVVYVRDIIATVPDVKEDDFRMKVNQEEDRAREDKFRNEIDRLMTYAEWKDVEPSKGD